MAVRPIVHEDAYTIAYDDHLEGIVFRWRRFVQDETFRAGCEQLLSAIENHDSAKVLIDSRELTVLGDADLEWLFEDWIPRTGAAGARYTATVYEESTIARLSMEKITEHVEASDAEGEVYMTTDLEAAHAWLEEQ